MSKYSGNLLRGATREERAQHFIGRSKEIHGSLYDYSLAMQTFTKQQALVTIICPCCGPFQQLATNHLAGKGCSTCAAKERMRKRYPEHAAALKTGHKICGCCKNKLPLECFSRSCKRTNNVSGWCRDCENKNKRTKYQARIRNTNLKKYGIDQTTYERLLKEQDYKCKICHIEVQNVPPIGPSKIKTLCVDHDHKTNKIRGLLCSHCNTGLGLFFDDITALESAILYLQQASQSGKA